MVTGEQRAKRIGIIDVAREAGVSTATVSFVLAGKSPVAPATREKVLRAVNKLGYRRNRHARALRRGSAPLVTAVVPDVTNPFYGELVAAIENQARQRGWVLSLMNCQLDAEREIAYLNTAIEESPDGLVYVPMTSDAVRTVESALDSGLPTVIVDEITSDLTLGSVSVDNAEGGRLAARHLRERGRRRVLLVGTPKGLPTSAARIAGFLGEAARLGLEVTRAEFDAVRTSDITAAAAELLITDRTIDAYFAANDYLAVQMLFALQRAGVRVPEDVAICGFDGITLGQTITPQLTTIRQPIDLIAEKTVEVLATPTEGRRNVVLPVSFLQGQTS